MAAIRQLDNGHKKQVTHPARAIASLGRVCALLAILFGLGACAGSGVPRLEVAVVTPDDKKTVLAMIVNHADLQPYLHPELHSRLPLRIKTHPRLGDDHRIEKFGEAVEFIDDAEASEGGAFLEVLAFDFEPGRAAFEILYDVEAVTIDGVFEKQAAGWRVKSFRVYER